MSEIKIWRYLIPPVDNIEGWGIFLLDSTGMFAAVTDYGNYAYKWTHHGRDDFRKFVIGLEKESDYLLGKVAPNKEYDGEGTIKRIKKDILEHRREGAYTKDFARREWILINNNGNMDSAYGFYKWYEETAITDASEFYTEKWPTSYIAFAKKLIPRLTNAIRKELAMEGDKIQCNLP